jgi:hypothetical protein
MGRAAAIERALRDAVELRVLARTATDGRTAVQLAAIARRRADDIGRSVPKSQAARVLGVSLTTLDKWVARGALPVLRHGSSSRDELQTESVIELADHVQALREGGLERALIAAAIARRDAARVEAKRPTMGAPDFFPDEHLRRWEDLALSAGERVAQAIELSRTATAIAAAAASRTE